MGAQGRSFANPHTHSNAPIAQYCGEQTLENLTNKKNTFFFYKIIWEYKTLMLLHCGYPHRRHHKFNIMQKAHWKFSISPNNAKIYIGQPVLIRRQIARNAKKLQKMYCHKSIWITKSMLSPWRGSGCIHQKNNPRAARFRKYNCNKMAVCCATFMFRKKKTY